MEVLPTPKHTDLTRDQRVQVHTLLGIDWTPRRICKHLDITARQVQYVKHRPLTPRKHRCGPKAVITTPCRKRLVSFIEQNKDTRRMRLEQVAKELE